MVEAQSHIFGSMSVLSQDSDRARFSMFMVWCLACVVWPSGLSGLSLALFRALPGGGLTPCVGGLVILSMLGRVYGPYVVSSTCYDKRCYHCGGLD